MSCSSCFQDTICGCTPYDDYLIINTTLTPGASYTWVITDKFDKSYSGDIVAEDDGTLQIPIAGLPNGLLSEFSGKFTLHIQDSTCSPVRLKLAREFDCVELTVKGGTYQDNTIGCEFDCIAGAGSSALISFTAQTTVTVDWADYDQDFGNNPLVQVYHELTPGIFTLVSVEILQTRVNGVLTEITINNAGTATGYVLLS